MMLLVAPPMNRTVLVLATAPLFVLVIVSEFPPEFIRGRYVQTGKQLTLKPYSLTAAEYEIDFFGSALTLIDASEFSGHSAIYQKVAGSAADVRAKATEAETFLAEVMAVGATAVGTSPVGAVAAVPLAAG